MARKLRSRKEISDSAATHQSARESSPAVVDHDLEVQPVPASSSRVWTEVTPEHTHFGGSDREKFLGLFAKV